MRIPRALAPVLSVVAAAALVAAAPGPVAQADVPPGWESVGSTLPGTVNDLVRYRGTLYAGGAFGLAAWDDATATWEVLSPAPGREVKRLVVAPDGTLYAGGRMRQGQQDVAFAAQWQGSGWKDLGVASGPLDPMGSDLFSMAVDAKGRLVVGGIFRSFGGAEAGSLAMYDGGRWSALPGPLNVVVAATALAFGPDGTLYVGAFGVLNNASGYAWALKNGTWSSLSGGNFLDYTCPGYNPCMGVLDMVVDGAGTVHAAGQLKIGSTLTGYATWDGRSWTAQPANGMTVGASLARDDQAGAVYAALGNQPGGDRWVVARMGDPVIALGTPIANAGTQALTVHGGVVYAAFGEGDLANPATPWQVASFALPAKTKASALPRNIRFIDSHRGKPTLAWKAPAYRKPGAYRVQYRVDGTDPWIKAAVIDGRRQARLPRSVAGEWVEVRVKARGADWATVRLRAPAS